MVSKAFEMNHGPQLTQNTEWSTNFPLKRCEEGKQHTHTVWKKLNQLAYNLHGNGPNEGNG